MAIITAMRQIDDYVPVTAAKNRLLRLIRELGERDQVLAITRAGVPAAVLLSPGRYEGLLETIEILSDRRAMRSLARSRRQAARGQWVSDAQVFGKRKS